MKLSYQKILIGLSFLFCINNQVYGQNMQLLKGNPNLWYQIKSQLDKNPKNESSDFITRLVEQSNVEKQDSLYAAYYQIMIKLERKFNIPAAIYVGEEVVNIAKQQRSLIHEADTYLNLNRYYDALGYL